MPRCTSYVVILSFAAIGGIGGGCRMVTSGQNAQGVALYNQGNYEAAARRFQAAIEAEPSDPDAYYNLAATHHHLWRLRKHAPDAQAAEQLYRQCLDRHPDHRESYRGLAVLLVERGQTEGAFQLLSNWAARSAAPSDARFELGRLYEEFSDTQQAQERYREAIEADPRNARALAALAQLQERSGDAGQALTNYLRSLTVDPSQPEVAQRAAALQIALGMAPTAAPTDAPRMATAPQGLPRY